MTIIRMHHRKFDLTNRGSHGAELSLRPMAPLLAAFELIEGHGAYPFQPECCKYAALPGKQVLGHVRRGGDQL